MQVLRPVGIIALSIIMLIGILALITELLEVEEVAKIVVIPSLILLIVVTGYCLFQSYKINNLR
jgi:TctA family transporter